MIDFSINHVHHVVFFYAIGIMFRNDNLNEGRALFLNRVYEDNVIAVMWMLTLYCWGSNRRLRFFIFFELRKFVRK